MSRSFYAQLHSRFGPTIMTPAQRLARIEQKRLLESYRWQPPTLPGACLAQLKKTKVAVVGGGLAGLLAARELCRKGVIVEVFEANPKVGGRVRSDQNFSSGRIIEIGAELIGSIHPLWRDLALEYGLAFISRMDGDLYTREGLKSRVWIDKILNDDELKQLESQMREVLFAINQDALNVDDPAKPWADIQRLAKFDKMSVADKLLKGGLKNTDRVWKAMQMLLENNNVAPLEKLNYLGLLCLVKGGEFGTDQDKPLDKLWGYWRELEIFRCADGCQKLAARLADEIEQTHKRKIYRNRVVTEIDLTKLTLKHSHVVNGKRIAGTSLSAKFEYVILAIPPSVWESVDILPQHPKEPSRVGVMEMGAAAKFFSNVKKRFWIKEQPPSAPYGGSLKIGQVWEGTDNQTRTDDQGVVLSVFTGTRIPTETDYLNGLAELYPHFKDNRKNSKLVDWSKENFIKTGYASPGKEQVLTVGEKLSKPFLEKLFFAGEHTQMDFFGYMEGALRSGARVAADLMLQACPQGERASAPRVASRGPRGPVVASAAPLRERGAFEREFEILLGATVAPEPERDVTTKPSTADLQKRVDEYFDYVNTEYTLADKSTVKARPHFRLANGFSGPNKCKKANSNRRDPECIKEFITQAIRAHDQRLLTTWFKLAIHRAAYGRGSPEGIRHITQALLNAGKFREVKDKDQSLSDSDTVRMLQWEFGFGVDCAGYVQRAFLFAWEGTKDDSAAIRAKYGFRKLGDENLYNLATNKKFRKVKYEEAEAGDLLILKPPKGETSGHTVLVRSRTVQSGKNVHFLEVDASWGGQESGDLTGGVHRRTFAYNADTGKWGDVQSDGSVVWNAIGPYKDHPVEGLYRPRD